MTHGSGGGGRRGASAAHRALLPLVVLVVVRLLVLVLGGALRGVFTRVLLVVILFILAFVVVVENDEVKNDAPELDPIALFQRRLTCGWERERRVRSERGEGRQHGRPFGAESWWGTLGGRVGLAIARLLCSGGGR